MQAGEQEDAKAAVRALQQVRPSLRDELQESLTRLGSGGRWLHILFLLGCLPGILNGAHLVAYVFLAAIPEYSCSIPELLNSKWSQEQIKNISGVTHCSYLAWNYTEIKEMSFNEARDSLIGEPATRSCSTHVFFESVPDSSIVSEWSLVCNNSPLRSTAQVALAVGKIIGSIVFGCISDRMGRKTSFVAASLIYLVAGPAAAFSFHYSAFLFFRAALGAAGTGTFFTAFTIIAEAAHPLKRPSLSILFNLSYPIGFLTLPLVALAFPTWRSLQLAISLPALILILPCWFLPESPRWLLAQGRITETMHVLRQVGACQATTTSRRLSLLGATDEEPEQEHGACWAGSGKFAQRVLALVRHNELRKRLLLLFLCWFACALTYHTLALSAGTLLQEPHRYVALLGAVELLAYLFPIIALRVMGRRSICSVFLLGTAVALLSLLIIPQEWTIAVLASAMIGRLCVSAAYSIIVLFTTELFPTVTRGTAIGSCTTIAQFASISAPYAVDFLGAHNAIIPSAICGVTTAIASILVLALPETCDLPLSETVEQVPPSSQCQQCAFNRNT